MSVVFPWPESHTIINHLLVADSLNTQNQLSHAFISARFTNITLNSVYIAGMTILTYDYILMLRHEIRFVWQSDWRFGKWLYLAARYLGFACNILSLVGIFCHGLSAHACTWIEVSSDWMLVFDVAIAQGLSI